MENKPKTGFLTDVRYREHLTGTGHPETPSRLDFIDRRIHQKGLIDQLFQIKPRFADREFVLKVHQREYIERLASFASQDGLSYLDPDTPVSSVSFKTALLAAGGVCQAIDEMMTGKIKNAFCAVRPPGHHAKINQAMGFCLINNVAVGARYVQQKYKLERVAIIDWDVHHGNGTQEIFYEDPAVFYFSVHQFPFYPGTGRSGETGKGPGEGYTLNCPLDQGSGDREYFDPFENILFPRLEIFKPQFIFISAGFDAHKDDPLAGMAVSTDGFGRLTSIVRQMAEQFCDGRLVSVLEGGYHLEALAESVEKHISVLME
ncbi:MAG: histone deacetylase [Nitrospirae bacterium]|nr:histone deacetylase [Nitrospirota bacterium]